MNADAIGRLKYVFECVFIAISCILLGFSGFAHLVNPSKFAISIGLYQLVHASSAYWIVLFLPPLQLAIAIAMLFERYRAAATFMAVALFGVFACSQWSVLVRGMTIDCGCFGSLSTVVSFRSASAISILFLIGLILTLSPSAKEPLHANA